MIGANTWEAAKRVLGTGRLTLGPVASHSFLEQPDHLAFQLARYRAAAALIGNASTVLEVGSGEGIGAGILVRGRDAYLGLDPDTASTLCAEQLYGRRPVTEGPVIGFAAKDIFMYEADDTGFHAVVCLDVIEHIPPEQTDEFVRAIAAHVSESGICVVGTPSANAAHLASPQSQVGHINLFTPSRLREVMAARFPIVQFFGMQDTALHFGHPEMAHYLIAVGFKV